MRCEKDKFLNEIKDMFDIKNLQESNNVIISFSSFTNYGLEKTLGEKIIENYIKILIEMEFLPKYIILNGETVCLALNSSSANIYLKKLQDRGVEILISDISVDYYGIGDNIVVGKIVGLKEILERQFSATKLIKL